MATAAIQLPTLLVNQKELTNLPAFIWKHEQCLRDYGAIKIQLGPDCQLALRKRKKKLVLPQTPRKLVPIYPNEPIYFVSEIDGTDESIQDISLPMNEQSFWSTISDSNKKTRLLNTNMLPNKSFFCDKTARSYFAMHRLPSLSLLKLAGKTVMNQLVPTVTRAFAPGAIFPLASAQQRLFSIHYHHEGAPNYWYTIPTSERQHLRRVLDQHTCSVCLDHGQLFIDPSVFDKNHIRYYRIVQSPNEFIVLSSGALAQSFTTGANWGESVVFALPSWINEAHAFASTSRCQCNVLDNQAIEMIDMNLFQPNLVHQYITSYLSSNSDDQSSSDKGL